jgi:hypothetical protein
MKNAVTQRQIDKLQVLAYNGDKLAYGLLEDINRLNETDIPIRK